MPTDEYTREALCICGWDHGLGEDEHTCLTPAEEIRAWRELNEGSFYYRTNMNDTLNFACADEGLMEAEDIPYILPLIAKYKHHAVTAYECLRRSKVNGTTVEPISCPCCHDGEEYKAARAAMEKIYDGSGPYGFMSETKWRVANNTESK